MAVTGEFEPCRPGHQAQPRRTLRSSGRSPASYSKRAATVEADRRRACGEPPFIVAHLPGYTAEQAVIVAMHVAAGAAAGALVGSRSGAVAAGLSVLHGVQDAVPHEDILAAIRSGVGRAVAPRARLATRSVRPGDVGRGLCAAPDLEDKRPLPRAGGRELYPSHRVEGWHREGHLPAWAQLPRRALSSRL